MSQRKPLLFVTLHGKREYSKLFDLFVFSLVLFGRGAGYSLLIQTSDEFLKKISYVKRLGMDVGIWVCPKKESIFEAAFARYDIFNYPGINNYETIMYVDLDILFNQDPLHLFSGGLNAGAINAFPEGFMSHDFYGKSLAIEAGRDDLLTKVGVSSGMMLFKDSADVRALFDKVKAHGLADLARGRVFSCFDQPYFNYYAHSLNLVDYSSLGIVAENNPTVCSKGKILYHFPGGVGDYGSKFEKMSEFLFRILESMAPTAVWGRAISLLCTPGSRGVQQLSLGADVFVEKSAEYSGFRLGGLEDDRSLRLSVPGFAVVCGSDGSTTDPPHVLSSGSNLTGLAGESPVLVGTRPTLALDAVSVLACVTHHFSRERFGILQATVAGLVSAGVAQIVVCTNAKADEVVELSSVLGGVRGLRFFQVGDLDHPFQLAMHHRRVHKFYYDTQPSITHFLYTEDDHLFSPDNLKYWLEARLAFLRAGMSSVPGWFRVERRKHDGIWLSTDYHLDVPVSASKVELVGGQPYVDMARYYAGAYMLDRTAFAEFEASEGFLSVPPVPANGGYYSVREHAAYGIASIGVSPASHSRYRVRLNHALDVIDPMSFIHHIPENYANGDVFKLRPVRDFDFIRACSSGVLKDEV